jgi:hypothetical protein
LEKLVLLLSVWYAIAFHIITVTNYHFMWCSVLINVMFNTVKLLSIISERTTKNKRMRENYRCRKLFILNYLGIIVWKLSQQGRCFFWSMNYQGFWNNQANLYEFFLLGTQVKTEIQNIAKLGITELTWFCCINIRSFIHSLVILY